MMSFNGVVKSVVGGLAFADATSGAVAQEPFFLNERSAIWRDYGHQRSQDNIAAILGQKLFFDGRLSRTGTTACASCHRPAYAFADPRRLSVSDSGNRGQRNAPSLINAGLLPTLMWDGRFRSLEQQAFGPFLRGEMGITVEEAVYRLNSDPEYVHLFHLAFNRHPTADGMARALAAYQRTLVSGATRFERFLRTNDARLLSSLERDGHIVFDSKAGCSSCHRLSQARPDPWDQGPLLLTDFRFHNLGIGYRSGRFTDPGRYGVTRAERDLGAFRTPSLRNVARTAPYMHDGSLETLEEVIEFYDRGGRANPNLSSLIRPLFLSEYEKAALVAFLRTLSDPEFAHVGLVGQW
jgi:cytochrome c peroxidase